MPKILITILAWLLIINGLIFLLWPDKARQGLLKQGYKIFRWQLFLFAIFLCFAAFALTSDIDIAFLRNLPWALVAVIIFLFFTVKEKGYKKLEGYLTSATVQTIRIWSVVQIIIGILMIILGRKVI